MFNITFNLLQRLTFILDHMLVGMPGMRDASNHQCLILIWIFKIFQSQRPYILLLISLFRVVFGFYIVTIYFYYLVCIFMVFVISFFYMNPNLNDEPQCFWLIYLNFGRGIFLVAEEVFRDNFLWLLTYIYRYLIFV